MKDDLDMMIGNKKVPTSVMLKRTFGYAKKEWPWFLLAFFLLAVYIAFSIVSPIFMGRLTDNLQSSNVSLKFIIGLAIGLFAIAIVSQTCSLLQAFILQKVGQRIVYQLRMEVYQHILSMSQRQFNQMPVGALVTRVVSYTNALSDFFTNIIVELVKNILLIVATYIMMFFISWKLSLAMSGFVILVFVISLIFRKVINKFFTQEKQYISDMNAFLNENLSGMKIIQIFNQEIKKNKQFTERSERLRKARYKVLLAFGIYRPTVTFIYFLAIATTFTFALQEIINAGEVVAFYLFLSNFFNPIQNLADKINGIQNAVTSSGRLYNLLDVKPDILDEEDAIEIDHFEGKIEFKNVWFAYKENEWILKDVSFVIEPKQTVAFVGATGAGKTTILGLIVRNYEIQKGQILIDGIDIKKIKITSLRHAIGQMLQDVFLFTGSIKNNVTLFDDSFTDEEVKEACTYVNANKFIDNLEKGYEQPVIERGENFSQGQRQLLSFARTVLHKPQILILDEATANIDTETEVLIQESLEKMRNIGTMLVVAHRLSTIQKADNIIVLQKGQIIESGNHQELLKKRGAYYKLYEIQFASDKE